MAYDKQVFIANQTLKAEELNKMNDQIEANEIAISSKQNELVSGINIKTINNQSILGPGNIDIAGGNGTVEKTTEEEIAAMGFTKNIGTVTAVKINGATKNPSNGVVDLGEISGGTLSDNTVIGWFKDGDESNDWTPSGGGSLTIGGASYTLGEYDDQGNLIKSAFGAGELNVGGTINLGKHDNGFCGVLNCGDINSGGNMNFYAFGQGINGITDIRFGQLGPVLSIDTLVRSNNLNVRANLIPTKDSLITTCDLGSSSSKWDNVYATNFKGTADSANKVNNALTIKNGSTTITYDGSSAKSITISGGSDSGNYVTITDFDTTLMNSASFTNVSNNASSALTIATDLDSNTPKIFKQSTVFNEVFCKTGSKFYFMYISPGKTPTFMSGSYNSSGIQKMNYTSSGGGIYFKNITDMPTNTTIFISTNTFTVDNVNYLVEPINNLMFTESTNEAGVKTNTVSGSLGIVTTSSKSVSGPVRITNMDTGASIIYELKVAFAGVV